VLKKVVHSPPSFDFLRGEAGWDTTVRILGAATYARYARPIISLQSSPNYNWAKKDFVQGNLSGNV
jgi:hypothetical protein